MSKCSSKWIKRDFYVLLEILAAMRFLVKSLVNSSPRQENVFAFELHYCVICWSLHEVRSLEVSALVVLLAVLAVVEGLHHLGVLFGGKHLKGPKKQKN